METFKKIDWNPALEDMIDDVFITDERMERESAMYKIMRDDFTDPFKDIEEDYANVNIELIKELLTEDSLTNTEDEEEKNIKDQKLKNNKKKNSKKTNNKKQDDEIDCKKEKRPYVPGIRKSQYYFPRRSCLTKPQHTMCLHVISTLLNSKQMLSKEEQLEMDTYLALKDKILEEQKEFLEFTKSKWDDTIKWPIKCNHFIMSKWKTKMEKFQQLPRYYIESKIISLSIQKINSTLDKNIRINFEACLHEGSFSKVMWPTFDRPNILHMNPALLLNKYQCVTPNKVTQHFRLPVSDDTYCEHLAIESKADFVISSSGLKCLLNNNLSNSNSNSWIIPVVIKSHNGKNVVYINKRMPPSIATIPEKNTWVYKYILRHHFIDDNDKKLKKEIRHTKENKTTLDFDLDNVESEYSAEFNDYLKIYEEDLYFSNEQNSDSHKSKSLDDTANGDKTNDEFNVTYNLFTIGPTEFLNCELQKHDVKKYQMLVRTKMDGIEVCSDKTSQYVMLAPKMEHQLEFGAEAVTFEEVSHQWASLICRPKTVLARVRITADTSEVIQIERHTTTSLSNEMRRLYDIKIEDSLSILHNIIEELLSLTPGQYIMQHIPQRGPFAYIYKEVKEVKEVKKNVFDLHTICQSEKFHTASKIPWPLIDTVVTTPALRQFKKMPAMFNVIYHPINNRPRGRPKLGTNKSAPRRSLRLKEATDK